MDEEKGNKRKQFSLLLFGMLGRKKNYLPIQLLFCSFILLFNLLKMDKRVIILFIVVKKTSNYFSF